MPIAGRFGMEAEINLFIALCSVYYIIMAAKSVRIPYVANIQRSYG
jgi:hypothetical protein